MSTRARSAEPTELARAWSMAVRVAGVAAVLSSAVAYGLHRFMGVGVTPLLALACIVGLAIGLRLPAAAPTFLQPLEDDGLEPLVEDRQ
jgi:hypothetical protein